MFIQRMEIPENLIIRSAEDVYHFLNDLLALEADPQPDREHLWTISLNQVNRVLDIELVSLGTVNRVLVMPMEVFSTPMQKRAVKIILAHNHPSGQLKPSAGDEATTVELLRCGRMLQTPLIDHVIITRESFYSFAESGLLKDLEMQALFGRFEGC